MPIIDKFKDMGTVVMGKIESGTVRDGDTMVVMPNKVPFQMHIFMFWYIRYTPSGHKKYTTFTMFGVHEKYASFLFRI